jgi:hypothetical protein
MIRVTKEEYLKEKRDRKFLYCEECKEIFKLNDTEERPVGGYRCPSNVIHGIWWIETMEDYEDIVNPEPTQPQEQYYCYVEGGQISPCNLLESANIDADKLATLYLGSKVMVLKVINTRIATSKIEYERS